MKRPCCSSLVSSAYATMLYSSARMTAMVAVPRGVDCLNGVVQRNTLIQRGFRVPARRCGIYMSSSAEFAVSSKGKERTKSYRLVFEKKGGKVVSPWHDVSLRSSSSGWKSSVFNFVCEIPRYTTAKMEISTKEERNPIAQDIKNGHLRHYCGPLFWNYGCLPQTWENPNVKHPELQVYGDNDPVDVVEIGSKAQKMGSVTEVKVLGCLAMIDDGEADYKVIAIDVTDPLADELNDIGDVEKKCRGVVPGIREWFRWYKTPDGKPPNEFGFGERALNLSESLEIINECHKQWKDLMEGKAEAGKLWKP